MIACLAGVARKQMCRLLKMANVDVAQVHIRARSRALAIIGSNQFNSTMSYKQPISTLIVIYTPDLQVLLLERADYPGSWQSVTGSREGDETMLQTAIREVGEETGFDAQRFCICDWRLQNHYEIYSKWRHRYPPGTTQNIEHVFGLCLPEPYAPTLAPREHLAFAWMPWQQAADKVFSASNAAAIRMLPERLALAAETG